MLVTRVTGSQLVGKWNLLIVLFKAVTIKLEELDINSDPSKLAFIFFINFSFYTTIKAVAIEPILFEYT